MYTIRSAHVNQRCMAMPTAASVEVHWLRYPAGTISLLPIPSTFWVCSLAVAVARGRSGWNFKSEEVWGLVCGRRRTVHDKPSMFRLSLLKTVVCNFQANVQESWADGFCPSNGDEGSRLHTRLEKAHLKPPCKHLLGDDGQRHFQ